MRTCSIDGCEGVHSGRGYCGKHYYRWKTYGDPLKLKRIAMTPAERKVARRRYKTKWRLANPEKMAAARAEWEAANPDIRRRYRRERKQMDPVSNRAYVHARKARIKAATVVPFTAEQLRQRFAFYGNRCWMCGDEGDTLDHVKPISKGGGHILCNLRPACADCNGKKGAQWPYPSSSRGQETARAA